jgi:hypothetical protein
MFLFAALQFQDSGSESGSDDDEEGGSVNWGGDDSDDDSDDEDPAYSQLKGRARWLKKNTLVKEKVVKDKEGRSKLRADAKAQAAVAAAKLSEGITATKSILPEEGLTPSILNRRVQELASQRGRKGKDNRQLLRELEALSRLSLQFGPRVEIPLLMYVISAQFGLQRTLDDYMETPTWKSCASYLERIANVLDDGYVMSHEEVDASDLILNNAGSKRMKAAAKNSDGAMAAVAADEKLVNPNTGELETENERAERFRVDKEVKNEEEKNMIPVVGSHSRCT